MLHRIGHIAMWQYIHRVHPLADRLSLRWGRAARLLRWPLPAMAPYRRRRLDVVRPMALGDILMCTPAFREVKRLNPACRVTFYTGAAYQGLAASCPFVNAVRPVDEAPPDAVWMFYETAMAGPSASPTGPCRRTAPTGGSSPRRHLARILGDQLGVDVAGRPAVLHGRPGRGRPIPARPGTTSRAPGSWSPGRPATSPGTRIGPANTGRRCSTACCRAARSSRWGRRAGRIAAPAPSPTTLTSSAAPPCRSWWRRSPRPTCSSRPRPAPCISPPPWGRRPS